MVGNSNPALNGYKEEKNVCNDLNNNNEIKKKGCNFLPDNIDFCQRKKGNHKIDIESKNGVLTAQVKKYKKGQFQHLDRHWVSDMIDNIPNLKNIKEMLKNLCEIPLQKNEKYIDKTKNRVLLDNENYTDDELIEFINTLNKNKREILEYAFYGKNNSDIPKYLIGVEYIKKKRSKIVFYKIEDIIDYLCKQNFEISKRKSVIKLGESISLQRKGGDSGRKGSNQLQFKIIISSLNIKDKFEYIL